jgi:hypothetical protein
MTQGLPDSGRLFSDQHKSGPDHLFFDRAILIRGPSMTSTLEAEFPAAGARRLWTTNRTNSTNPE